MTGWSCCLGGRLITPSLHPPVASLSIPASAPLVPGRADAWLQGPNRQRERLSRFAGGFQTSPHHGRPSWNLSFKDAEVQPTLLWDGFPSLPTTAPMTFSFIVTASTYQTPSFMSHIKSCNMAMAGLDFIKFSIASSVPSLCLFSTLAQNLFL